VTAKPTAEWAAQQIIEAFPDNETSGRTIKVKEVDADPRSILHAIASGVTDNRRSRALSDFI